MGTVKMYSVFVELKNNDATKILALVGLCLW